MPLRAAKSGGQKYLNQLPSKRMADHKATKADHVQIIVLDALVRRKALMNQAGSNSRHFIRGDRCANTTPADGNTALDVSAAHRTGQRHDKIWIIIVHLRLSIAEIDYFMASFAQHPGQIYF
jgi:hypothetical protein